MTYSTLSNQEVPSTNWNSIYQSSMYELNLPETVSDTELHNSFSESFIKAEDPYLQISNAYQSTSSSMLASPTMNMPILCRPYNAYSPASAIQSMAASPSGNSSTYSASPLNSPQQHFTQDELMMRYGMRHPLAAAGYPPHTPVQQPSSEYAYYYNEYGMKRRKRDCELTSEELEKRRVRRERNKQAALRCRTRRRERIDALEQETTQIEEDNIRVEKEICDLQNQIQELHTLLKEHDCPKQLPYSGGNV